MWDRRSRRDPIRRPQRLRAGTAAIIDLDPDPLVSFASGTFTRSTEGSYLTAAATMAWAGVDVLRSENRGDGNGAYHLFEGARETRFVRSEELDNAIVSKTSATVLANMDTAPDGVADADRVDYLASSVASVNQGYAAAGVIDNADVVLSAWGRMPSGTGAVRLVYRRKDNTTETSSDLALDTTWKRVDFRSNSLTGATNAEARWQNQAAGGVQSIYLWGLMLEEQARFPSTYIRTTSARLTRTADTLSFASYPDRLRTGKWRFDWLPRFGTAEGDLVSGNSFTLWSWASANDRIRCRHNGTSVILEVIAGGAVKVATGALTFSRHQKLVVTIDSAGGAITVSGATTGNGTFTGTAWTMATGTMRVGGVQGAADEAHSRLGEPYKAA